MAALMRGGELIEMFSPVGCGYRFVHPDPAPGVAVLRGRVGLAELRPGLFVHHSDVWNLQPMTTRMTLSERITVVLTLEGCTDVAFGASRLRLEPGQGAGRSLRAQGALICLARPEQFTRHARRGGRERKLVISVTAQWLESAGLCAPGEHEALADFSRRHLSVARWHPSPKAVALAEQIMSPPRYTPLLQRLYVEGRAIEILTEAFASLAGSPGLAAELRPRDDRRVRELRAFLDEQPATDLSVEEMAARVGTNPSTLQRNFRAAFGMSVFEYLRERRLQKAREALEQGGVSVARAAEIAGYASAANFATAYRRRFGLSPRQSKAWV